MFFYEHIGHMQFSTLTLYTYLALMEHTNGDVGNFVPWVPAQVDIEKYGFSKRLSFGELDRFCYGFECIDRYANGRREIALTEIGKTFLQQLLKEAPNQHGIFAFLARPAKRKGYLNVTLQETTFFSRGIYDLIAEYGFRKGPARDFLKSIETDRLMEFLAKTVDMLNIIGREKEYTIRDCIMQVEHNGKSWASVGGKYSWYIYPQKFILDFNQTDWDCYENAIKNLIRPPEWGGGKDVSYKDLMHIIKDENRFIKFRKTGIVRPVWQSDDIKQSVLRLTSPGYLMWERKSKGFVYEFLIKKTGQNIFSLNICNSSDFPQETLDHEKLQITKDLPAINFVGNKNDVVGKVASIFSNRNTLLKLQSMGAYNGYNRL